MGATPRQIERVYRRRYSAFVGAMTAVVRNPEDAADVVQDGFAQALARRREFRGDGALEAWIWKIVLRKAIDRLAVARTTASLDELPERGLPIQKPTRNWSGIAAVAAAKAVGGLPPLRSRSVVLDRG